MSDAGQIIEVRRSLRYAKEGHPYLADLTEWAVEARYPGDWLKATEADACSVTAGAIGSGVSPHRLYATRFWHEGNDIPAGKSWLRHSWWFSEKGNQDVAMQDLTPRMAFWLSMLEVSEIYRVRRLLLITVPVPIDLGRFEVPKHWGRSSPLRFRMNISQCHQD